MSDKTVYLIGGLGCSGKSTFAKKLAQDKAIPYFRVDNVYLIVQSNLHIPQDKLVFAPMASTWEDPSRLGIPDFGIYGSMRECVKQAYLEFFSYNIPQSFVMEGEALFWNRHERDLVAELLSERDKIYLCLQPDYEQWLKNRTSRILEGGHIPDFREEGEYNNLLEEYRQYLPDKTIIIKEQKECSLTGGTNYQSDDFSDPKWEVFNFPKDMSGKTFLDISCNTGWFSRKAADCGAKVTGVDISWQVLAEAQKRVPEGKFVLSRIEDYDIPEFDYVLCSSAFHYYTHREEVIKKIAKSTTQFTIEVPLLESEKEDIQYQGSYMENFCALVSEPLLLKWLNKYFKQVEKIGETIQPEGKNRPVYRCTR